MTRTSTCVGSPRRAAVRGCPGDDASSGSSPTPLPRSSCWKLSWTTSRVRAQVCGEPPQRHRQGHPEALAILGFDPDAPIGIPDVTCSPPTVSVGGTVTISFTLQAATTTRAAVDYVIHYQGARGVKAGTVFKLSVKELPAGEPVRFSKEHRFGHASVRRIHPGPHRIEVRVNGRVLDGRAVEVIDGEVSA